MDDDETTALTDFQVEVAKLFFSLPTSGGFLLAGGGALLAQRLTARPTQDLDFFTASGAEAVHAARDESTEAAEARGWLVTRIRDQDTYCRLLVSAGEDWFLWIFLRMVRHSARTAGGLLEAVQSSSTTRRGMHVAQEDQRFG